MSQAGLGHRDRVDEVAEHSPLERLRVHHLADVVFVAQMSINVVLDLVCQVQQLNSRLLEALLTLVTLFVGLFFRSLVIHSVAFDTLELMHNIARERYLALLGCKANE